MQCSRQWPRSNCVRYRMIQTTGTYMQFYECSTALTFNKSTVHTRLPWWTSTTRLNVAPHASRRFPSANLARIGAISSATFAWRSTTGTRTRASTCLKSCEHMQEKKQDQTVCSLVITSRCWNRARARHDANRKRFRIMTTNQAPP